MQIFFFHFQPFTLAYDFKQLSQVKVIVEINRYSKAVLGFFPLWHTVFLFCDLRSGLCRQSNKLALIHGTPILLDPISVQLKEGFPNSRLSG